MKLFAFFIGGGTHNSLIELHDACFFIGEKMEDCYDNIRAHWWGDPKTLHVDCYGELTQADGYKVSLHKTPSENDELKLYFINLGGYISGDFQELHKNVFVVARTEVKARVKALKQIQDWSGHHKDCEYDVEECFCINSAVEGSSYYLHLDPIADQSLFSFSTKYFRLNE